MQNMILLCCGKTKFSKKYLEMLFFKLLKRVCDFNPTFSMKCLQEHVFTRVIPKKLQCINQFLLTAAKKYRYL